jgi:hypothetical protein
LISHSKPSKIEFVTFRGVAQLVAHVVWDHGAGSSSLLTPTDSYLKDEKSADDADFFYCERMHIMCIIRCAFYSCHKVLAPSPSFVL